MAINVSVQYNNAFLPDIILTVDPRLLYYLREPISNVMEEVLYLWPMKQQFYTRSGNSVRISCKNEVCSARESTNRCLLKPIELPEAFWFEPIFQGLGEYKARSLKRSVVVHCLGEFTKRLKAR